MFLLFIVHSLLFQITLNPFHPEYCAFSFTWHIVPTVQCSQYTHLTLSTPDTLLLATQSIMFLMFIVHTLNRFHPGYFAFSHTGHNDPTCSKYTVSCSRLHLTLSTLNTVLLAILYNVHGRMFPLFIVHSVLFQITFNPFYPEYCSFSKIVHPSTACCTVQRRLSSVLN